MDQLFKTKQKKKKPSYVWYIKPEGGDELNGIIADLPGIDRYDDFGETVCFEGKIKKSYPMWKMPSLNSLNAIKKFAQKHSLLFSVWVKQGKGKVRLSWLHRSKVENNKKKLVGAGQQKPPLF